MRAMWCLLAGLGLAAGCASEQGVVTVKEPAVTEQERALLPILAEGTGNNAALTQPGLHLLQSEAELAAAGLTELVGSARFEEQSMIVLALGERPTGGFAASIASVVREGGLIFVRGTAIAPGPNDAVTLAMTHPYAMVVVPKVSGTLVGEIDSR